jgi:hypothetical protein
MKKIIAVIIIIILLIVIKNTIASIYAKITFDSPVATLSEELSDLKQENKFLHSSPCLRIGKRRNYRYKTKLGKMVETLFLEENCVAGQGIAPCLQDYEPRVQLYTTPRVVLNFNMPESF